MDSIDPSSSHYSLCSVTGVFGRNFYQVFYYRSCFLTQVRIKKRAGGGTDVPTDTWTHCYVIPKNLTSASDCAEIFLTNRKWQNKENKLMFRYWKQEMQDRSELRAKKGKIKLLVLKCM